MTSTKKNLWDGVSRIISDLIPKVTGQFDLGSATAKFRNLFLSGSLSLPTGAAGTSGTATLVGGTVTVSTTAVSATSRIIVSRNTSGGTDGHLNAPVASIVAGTSFVINSSSGADTSTVNWFILD